MKAIVYVLGFLSVGIIFCGWSDDNVVADTFVKAKLDNQSWSGSPELSLNDITDTLIFHGVAQEEVIFFKIKLNGTGTYQLSKDQAIYYTTLGGDVLTTSYSLDPETPSYVKITTFNEIHKQVIGEFDISLVQNYPTDQSHKLAFSEGEFSGVITLE
jgi:hypothetical protein